MSKTVYTLKILTGETIIAELVETGDKNKNLCLKKPIQVVFTQRGPALIPFDAFVKDNKINVKPGHVIYCEPASQEVHDMYIEQTTGITMANACEIPQQNQNNDISKIYTGQ